MKLTRFVVGAIVFSLGILPSLGNIEGGISESSFYDLDKTIMTEMPVSKKITTEKYWEKNLFYQNKYRPVFMLSNKELYKLMPETEVSVVQRIIAPSVYNISLKSASIKSISLKPINSAKTQPQKPKKQKQQIVKKETIKPKTPDVNSIALYEQAKNQGVESEDKINTAIKLKNTKNISNYNLAFDLLDDVIRREPYNAYAYYVKGQIYTEKNDNENAMKNYVEALKINPCSKQCCIGIAKILEPANKELAKKYYYRALNSEE